MPRSNYIYLVVDLDGGFHGFTVKHEMVAAIKRRDIRVLYVLRMRDNQAGHSTRLDESEWKAF